MSPPDPALEDNHALEKILRTAAEDPSEAWREFLEQFAVAVYAVVSRFVDSYDERMDLFVYVGGRLRENGMRRVHAYAFRPEAPCTFKTYLSVVVRNLALDYVRSVDGRYRPFKNMSELKADDRLIFEYHIRDHRPLEQVRQMLEARHGIRLETAELKQRAESLERSLSPNQRWRLLSRFWAHQSPLSIDPTQEAATEAGQVFPLLGNQKDPEAEFGAKSAELAFQDALARIEPRKRLALVLRFRNGLKVREVARVLNATEKQVEHWVREETAQLRDHLRGLGFTRDDLDPDQLSRLWEE